MALLSVAASMLALLAASPAAADPVARWRPLIEEAAARCGVPAAWIAQVMRAESGGRTQLNGRPIVSRAGAMGLMQLMPGTWADMRGALGLGPDPHAPRDNILAGACYLRRLHDRFGHPGLFAAYNAGPARYAAHLATGRPLPKETRVYLAGLVGPAAGSAVGAKILPIASERPGLFFELRPRVMTASGPPPNSLFVALRQGTVTARSDR